MKEISPIEPQLGTCIKNTEKVVLFQNELCIGLCGDMQGKVCDKRCMENYCPVNGMTLIKHVEGENATADAVVINDGIHLTTLLYPQKTYQDIHEEHASELKSFGLSKSEIQIFLKVIQGKKNSVIEKELFISKATLKTHLNNIYKKLPDSWHEFKKRR